MYILFPALDNNKMSVIDYTGKSMNYYRVTMKPANWYQWFDPHQPEDGPWPQVAILVTVGIYE